MKKGFEVEWCSFIPLNEFGDADIDRASMVSRDFETRAAARAYAKRMLPADKFGCVTITEFVTEFYEDGMPGQYRRSGGDRRMNINRPPSTNEHRAIRRAVTDWIVIVVCVALAVWLVATDRTECRTDSECFALSGEAPF